MYYNKNLIFESKGVQYFLVSSLDRYFLIFVNMLLEAYEWWKISSLSECWKDHSFQENLAQFNEMLLH